MMSVYKPVTLITGTTPTAASMIALGSILANEAASMGIVTSRLLGALVLHYLGGTLIAAVKIAVKLHGRRWKYDVKGVQAFFFNFK